MKPPENWRPLPELFVVWKNATGGGREKRYNKYIDDLVRLKQIDVRQVGDGIQRQYFWRTHKPDLFD